MQTSKNIPPARRTAIWQYLTEAARNNGLCLPVCPQCKTVQYPPREICKSCLYHELEWRIIDPLGELVAYSRIYVSIEQFFNEHAPWPVGLVKLDCGPVLLVHLVDTLTNAGQRVRVLSRLDSSRQAIFIAIPEGASDQDFPERFDKLLYK